jgi:hypothetical protein
MKDEGGTMKEETRFSIFHFSFPILHPSSFRLHP